MWIWKREVFVIGVLLLGVLFRIGKWSMLPLSLDLLKIIKLQCFNRQPWISRAIKPSNQNKEIQTTLHCSWFNRFTMMVQNFLQHALGHPWKCCTFTTEIS